MRAPIGFTQRNSNFWNGCFTIGEQQFSSMYDNPTIFLTASRKKSRNIDKCNDGDIKCIAKPDESGCFSGGIYIQYTCQKVGLVCNDSTGHPVESRKANNDVFCKILMNLQKLLIINNCIDDLFYIIGLVGVGRDNLIEAVKYWSQFADVMVTARELNINQIGSIIRAIKRQKITGPSGDLIRLELFAHGALCMAVSGKCYLSLDQYNSSANRGACYQLCRRPYRVTDFDGEVELVVDNEYIMSPKDLCTIGFLDQIVKAGVSVLKIEGRGRSPEYVKTVIACYREAIDAIAEGSYSKEKVHGWLDRLKTVYNRGFWNGYYLGQTMGEWAEQHGSVATQSKVYIGKVTNYFTKLQVAEIKLESGYLASGDRIYIQGPTTGVIEMTIPEIRVDLKPVEKAKKGDVCSVPVQEFLRRADKIYKIIGKD